MLKTRMMILNQGNVIDNEIKDFMDASIDLLHEEYPTIEDEKFVMFTTHLAMAIALVGSNLCATISMPGKIFSDETIIGEVQKGKKAFGFTAQHAENVLPVLINAILKEKGEI